MSTKAIKNLLDAIGKVEAGRAGYNALYLPAAKKLGPQKLTTMTIDQVQKLQDRMVSSGSTACGRYQFLRKTLAALVKKMRIPLDARFDAALQDRLAMRLLENRGLSRFRAGRLSREGFANNLAKEWASLPVVTAINGKKIGQSYYAGDGLNHALMTPAALLKLVDAIKAAPAAAAPKPAAKPVEAPKPVEAVPAPESPQALSVGARGTRVRQLQAELARLNYHSGEIDGIFGNLTRDAIMAFQADNGLGTDGKAGPETWAALATAPPRPLMTKRTHATVKELADKGDATAKAAVKGKWWSWAAISAGVSTAATSVADNAGALAALPIEPLRESFDLWGPWLFGSVIVGAGVYFLIQSRKVGAARVADHQDAKTL